ncbi:type I polyketide synthase [Acuticoccus sp. I52.16.1]|uniref:type I polyketide synthase n=1 Tax=Acuticoccus sp. I52.16.1 TaxID=2928472 RepID=UPI001FD590C4|nr:type I polyketide synthase [Acuticoccus sp. I52.16.1]UOM34328.1 SDR family NAD(P)-dependent oxidoreductase [Acuticoccus sp. I52.16.1]
MSQLDDAIAITGMSGRFPGAPDIAAFWRLLVEGREGITFYTDEELLAAGVAPALLRHPNYVRAAPALTDVDMFDAAFFGISPKEAELMDPQHRLFLEHAWLALENAGRIASEFDGRIGIYGGSSISSYLLFNLKPGEGHTDSLQTVLGNDKDYLATRVAYKLGLDGPAVTVQTACSTALAAVSLACESLLTHQCDMALAGGATVRVPVASGYLYEEGSILSHDGHCRTFDAGASGTLFGSGVGIVVLRRLEEAEADGDHIHAVIRGTALNNDGDHKVGFAAPSVDGQSRVIAAALTAADVSADTIDYVEAHGTATPIGDPIEVRALTRAFRATSARTGYCGIGSAKTNVGHLESAAGVAGLIKAVLALKHRQIPANLHYAAPNPDIDFAASPFRVVDRLADWPRGDHPRRAGVNSFGIGGTNVHVVLEEAPDAPEAPAAATDRTRQPYVLSARSEASLKALAQAHAARLAAPDAPPLGDAAFTAATGRRHFPHRLAVVGADAADVAGRLAAFADGGAGVAGMASGEPPRIAFLFTGQGSQYVGMGRALYAAEPRFRAVVDRASAILRDTLGAPLPDLVFAAGGDMQRLDATHATQVALYVLEYALATTWRAWGIAPAMVAGHSVGEIAAAAVAGVFSFEDGLTLASARGRLMQDLPREGAMVSVATDEASVVRHIAAHEGVAIAAVNGPRSLVLSGAAASVEAIAAALAAEGVRTRPLTVSHAFHSPLMAPMLEPFRALAGTITYRAPTIPIVSNVTGALAGAELADPAYWVRHVMAPVRFGDAVDALYGAGICTFLEIGPKPVLTALGREALEGTADAETTRWLPSLTRPDLDEEVMFGSLASLHVAGAAVDWANFHAPWRRRRVELPGTVFERRRFWVEPSAAAPIRRRAAGTHPLLGTRLRTPGAREVRHETVLAADEPAFLADHRVFGAPVVPATGFLEAALAAARAEWGEGPVEVRDVAFRAALALGEGPTLVQTALVPVDGGRFDFAVYSLGEEDDTLHARGRLARAPASHPRAAPPPHAAGAPIDPAAVYAAYAERGLDYGAAFRGVRAIEAGDGVVRAQIHLPAAAGPAEPFTLHPALLDACFQAIGVVFTGTIGEGTYLPVGLERLAVFGPVPAALTGTATIRDTGEGGRHLADMVLTGPDGVVVAVIEGLESRKVSRETVLGSDAAAMAERTHVLAWRDAPPDLAVPPVERPTLVVGAGPVAAELAAALGAAVVSAVPEADGLAQVEAVVLVVEPAPVDDGAGMLAAAEVGVAALLALVQAVVAAERSAAVRITVVTRGAASLAPSAAGLAAAPLAGMARAIGHEFPELALTLVDLDPADDEPGGAVERLTREIRAPDGETEVAWRGARRRAARFTRLTAGRVTLPAGPFRLVSGAGEGFAAVSARALERRAPAAGEVEIEVAAMGLNYRDVLGAMGLYPGDLGLSGSECAGRVVRVGPGVDDLAVGDAVVAIAQGSFASHVTVAAGSVFAAPTGVDLVAAAGLPVVTLTAWYGLTHLAGLKRGETVLIHSATGGVGLMALAVARHLGAEVIATASPAKHEILRRMGIAHIASSRSGDFADVVRAATGGAGVDVILDSLPAELMEANLAALAQGGRFVEIGRRDIWTATEMAAARPDAAYHVVDFDALSRDDPALLRRMLAEPLERMAAGAIAPPPTTPFAAERLPEAMAFMQTTRHIGKVVLTPERETTPAARAFAADPAGTYLVTGGLGGLGLHLARFLVEKGARHLTLVGRSAPGAAAEAELARLADAGATVTLARLDVADGAAVTRLVAGIDAGEAPLRGVFHLAGGLDDSLVTTLGMERFRAVMAPKVAGAFNLHAATRASALDVFVLYGSLTGLLGAPGQANYCAANTFLDALAAWRRAEGLPALAIDWGPWAEVGMAAGTTDRLGGAMLTPEAGAAMLERLLGRAEPAIAVVPYGLADFLDGTPAERAAVPFFADVREEVSRERAETARTAALREDVLAATGPDRAARLATYLTDLLAALLMLDASEPLAFDRSLQEVGLDSLVGIQLRNRVRSDLGVDLPIDALLADPTIARLLVLLSDGLGAAEPGAQAGARASIPRGGDGDAPLSFAQRRMWFLATMDPDSPFYSFTVGIDLVGPLRREAFDAAIATIVARHEALRTVFPVVDGEPVQRVVDGAEIGVDPVDLSALDAPAREAALDRVAAQEARRVFDLAAGPLMAVRLVRLAPEVHRALVTMHHIVTDGWSQGIFAEEFAALYGAGAVGGETTAAALPVLPVRYRDFARWQIDQLAGPRAQEGLAFWGRRLAAPLPDPPLPFDRSRREAELRRGATTAAEIDAATAERVKAMARAERATLFTALLSAFTALLHRLTGDTDVLVGTIAAGRVRPEVEGVIGFFANMVPLRADLAGDPSFLDLLAQERDVVAEALAHQDIPFDYLVEALAPPRAVGRNPFTDVIFVLQRDAGKAELEIEGLTMSARWEAETGAARFDLEVHVWELADGRLSFQWIYDADLFDAETVASFARHYEALLRGALADGAAPVSALPLAAEAVSEVDTLAEELEHLSDEEVERLLRELQPDEASAK